MTVDAQRVALRLTEAEVGDRGISGFRGALGDVTKR